jgi:hypothetical protein
VPAATTHARSPGRGASIGTPGCGRRGAVEATLERDWLRPAYTFRPTDARARRVTVWTDNSARVRIVAYLKDGRACIIGAGDDWRPAAR